MTESSSPRPVPGPPRPGSRPVAADVPGRAPEPAGRSYAEQPFADLEQRPVAEHVAVFEAEHERLQRELGGIDPR